jgi:UrcA family protein
MRRTNIALLGLGFGLGLSLATPALADPIEAAPTLEVRYARADLTNLDAAAALYERIQAAAEAVCRDANAGLPDAGLQTERCIPIAVNAALETNNLQRLADLYEIRQDQSFAIALR